MCFKQIKNYIYDRMDFWVILYSLLCVVVGGGAVSFLYKRGQTMGAIFILVLSVLIFIFFGLRWFPKGSLIGSTPEKITWPPIVNMCPDFMITWVDPLTSKVYCYDANNVYGLQTAGSAPPLTNPLQINSATNQSAYLIKDPAQNTGATDLTTGAARWPLASALKTNSNSVLTPTAKYLRWEGVWDGSTLKAANVPLP